MSKRHHEPMRNFILVSSIVWLGGFAIAGQMAKTVDNSSLMESQRARVAQLCQIDPSYCPDV